MTWSRTCWTCGAAGRRLRSSWMRSPGASRIGGRSPILERTEAQALALGRVLGPAWPVYVGMRHWHPFIGETVERMVACGERRVVAIVLAPHYSALSVGAYEKRLLDAARGRLDLALVRSWGDHPKFLEEIGRASCRERV